MRKDKYLNSDLNFASLHEHMREKMNEKIENHSMHPSCCKKKKKKVTVLVLSTSDYTAVLWKITLQTETRSVFLYR